VDTFFSSTLDEMKTARVLKPGFTRRR